MTSFVPQTGTAAVTALLRFPPAPWEGGYWSCTAGGEAEVGRGKETYQRSCSESVAGGGFDSSLRHLTLLLTHYMLAFVRLFIRGFICPVTKTPHNNLNSRG